MKYTVFDSTHGKLLSEDDRFVQKEGSNAMFHIQIYHLSEMDDLCSEYDVVIKGFGNKQSGFRPVIFIYPKNKDFLTKGRYS